MQNNSIIALKPLKIQHTIEDEQPQFQIDQFPFDKEHQQGEDLKNMSSFNMTSQLSASKISEPPQSNKSHISSILNSPNKRPSLHKKYSQYESISPDKNSMNFKIGRNRPAFSAHKNNLQKQINISQKDIKLERTSFSPSISPDRKSIYWQTWLLPMNSTARQSTEQPLPKISAFSYCAMMADTHQILASHNYSIQKQVASLTKIMTAYTTISICSQYGIKIRQHYVPINKAAAYMQGTTAGLKLDEQILIIDLLYALLLPSGNDAGVALAQFFGKFLSYKFARENDTNDKKASMDKFKEFKQFYDTEYDKESMKLFIFEMNKNCHRIGLKHTHFSNPTGLSDSNNYSTAKDMAFLTSHCLKNHTLRTMFKKKYHSCQVKNEKLCITRQLEWKNTNRHIFQFRDCIGIKTGITPAAGPCLSSAYKVLGRQLIVIVIKCDDLQARYTDSQALYKWCRKKIRAF